MISIARAHAPRAFAALLLALAAMLPAAAGQLLPHRAAYTLSLARAGEPSGIVGAHGALGIEWSEGCDGWIVHQRIRLSLISETNGEVKTETGFTSWESKDGLNYRFSMRTLRDGAVSEQLEGEAEVSGGGGEGEARFVRPSGHKVKLPKGSVFPTKHTIELLERAEAGENGLLRVVFDGATREGMAEVNAVIGSLRQAQPANERNELTNRPLWPMRLAFFQLDDGSEQPHYELSVQLLDNGVASELIMDYGDFAIRATLDKIEALPTPDC